MQNVQIVILAGGKSKRMNSGEPKALAIFKGKPFLEHILNTVSSLKLPSKPIIVVGHKKERIKEVLGHDHNYVEQAEQLGTGHAVKIVKDFVSPENDVVLVISTDQPTISKETIERIISKHSEKTPTITMATLLIPDFDEWRSGLQHFGRIIRKENGEVLDIVEFKDATQKEKLTKEVNPAMYAFDANWLWENIEKLKNENAQAEYYLTDLVKLASSQNKKIETISVHNLIEGLQPNTQEELILLEKFST